MRLLASFVGATFISTVSVTAALASTPDAYVVNFRNEKNADSQVLDQALEKALPMAQVNVEEVIIDTTTAALWEKGAHEAFDREIVPIFNQWVGLPGFAAVVDADTKHIIGCVNGAFSAEEMAQEIREMAARATGQAYLSKASTAAKSTQCPPPYNEAPPE